jgi:4-hydroxy-tetrahydrodipicolinate synthase
MSYTRDEAKAHAKAHLRGIWAAALCPFRADLSIDDTGFQRNIAHWVDDLGIAGLFIAGKQGEFYAMSVAERKRCFDLAIEATKGRARTIMSCSDQNMDVVIDLARHAEKAGADYIVVHAPVLHFVKEPDEALLAYYKAVAAETSLGIALWSHPDSGYLMSPELCARLADIPNIVAIKYSVPREMYARLTRMVGDNLIVSTASEDEWLENMIELNWRTYLCSNPPYLYQRKGDCRMASYTNAAFAGRHEEARAISKSLDPVRAAFKRSKPHDKPHAHAKFWQELLGQVGGPVRRPMLNLNAAERDAIARAFEACGLGASHPLKTVA